MDYRALAKSLFLLAPGTEGGGVMGNARASRPGYYGRELGPDQSAIQARKDAIEGMLFTPEGRLRTPRRPDEQQLRDEYDWLARFIGG